MAPKFPNDPPTDSVRDRLDQFIQVAGRAVYPPLAVAPSPTTAGHIWWDISDTVKIRNEANTAWASLATTMGAVSFKEAQTLTPGEQAQSRGNLGLGSVSIENTVPVAKGGTGATTAAVARTNLGLGAGSPASASLGIVAVGSSASGSYIEYKTSNGETWRLIYGSLAKASSSTSDIPVTFGFSFMTAPQPVVSNGDSTSAISIILSSFSASATGFTVAARSNTGEAYLGAYRANYTVLGRVS